MSIESRCPWGERGEGVSNRFDGKICLKFNYLWFRIECVVMLLAVPHRTFRYMVMMEEIIVFQTADLKEKEKKDQMLNSNVKWWDVYVFRLFFFFLFSALIWCNDLTFCHCEYEIYSIASRAYTKKKRRESSPPIAWSFLFFAAILHIKNDNNRNCPVRIARTDAEYADKGNRSRICGRTRARASQMNRNKREMQKV